MTNNVWTAIVSRKALLSGATLAASVLATFTVFAQQGEQPLRLATPAQLRIISGDEARATSLGASVSFGNEEGPRAASTGGAKNSPKDVGGGSSVSLSALPLWMYSATAAQNGRRYSGMVVGGSPSVAATTKVPIVLIPVILKITQGGTTYTFDPTVGDAGCIGAGHTALGLTQASPLLTSSNTTISGVGPTQYTDAVLKAEFWNAGGSNAAYHLLLSPVTVNPALTISVKTAGATAEVYSLGAGLCGTYGATTNGGGLLAVININTIDALLQSYISTHGLNASQLPFFITYNSVISIGAANNLNNCCVLGYHDALGLPGQTYGIAEFEGRDQTVFGGTADVSVVSHEIAEWVNDPTGTNPTPPWGNLGQVSGCQNNFEDGDPLTGTLMPPVSSGGFTYHLQELAYFSWFYGAVPSLGLGGKYSSNGTFHGFSKLCPPGGTH
jgi:hypothetical protein